MTAAVIVMRQNRYMKRFAQAGAVDALHAASLDAIGCRGSWVFRRMVRQGVFVPCGEARFYMDVTASREFVRRRKQRIIVFLAVCAILVAIWLVFAWYKL